MATEIAEENLSMKQISGELNIPENKVKNVITLLSEDNTIPFIARYRKELTGGLDEVQILAIHDRYQYMRQLDKRKQEVIRLIDEQDKLTEALAHSIKKAQKLQEVEDLYRPYKQKRRTRATTAKEKGLEPLADWMLSFPSGSVETEAKKYISEPKGVNSAEEAIQGASDILAEGFSDDASIRKKVRALTWSEGLLVSTVKNKEKDEKEVYEMYYSYSEKIKHIVPHRILALNRGEKEDVLKVQIEAPAEEILRWMGKTVLKSTGSSVISLIETAIADSYKRLIAPAVEREIRQTLTETADEQAIHIFSENLKHLLMQPPMKGRVVLGVDPAFRTGCKLAVVDDTGKVMEIAVIYPTPPRSQVAESKEKVLALLRKYNIEMIAIGNGTASRETEAFIVDVIKEFSERQVYYVIVNEAGASVYSASALAREEFPELKVEERSAVSIARRLQDPLAELVKIDPKSVGVGQYQHDVSQKALNESLGFVVETAVNKVGVNVNTASASLLQHVAGFSKTVASNIVNQRNENGKYTNRRQLKKVPRLGDKAFVQGAGFLRILDGDHPLDATAIHPESYADTEKLLGSLGLSLKDLGSETLIQKLDSADLKEAAALLDMGELTLKDIAEALKRPGRDPREDIPAPLLKTDVLSLEDLKQGMELEGTVRNVVDFGAFVDIGVKQDGLVHISKLSRQFVKHPLDVVHVGQIVKVWVEQVDVNKGRIALTMLSPQN